MRLRIVVPTLLGLALVIGMASAAHAQAVPDCASLIAELRTATGSAEIIGRNADKDRAGLIDKLDMAAEKLEAGKLEDAVQKLVDFQDKVQQLAGAGKMSFADAGQLSAAADLAIACIQSGDPSRPSSCNG